MPQTGRRNALKLLSGSFALASFPWARGAAGTSPAGESAADDTLALLFDGSLRTRVLLRGQPLTGFQASEALLMEKRAIDAFAFAAHTHEDVRDPRHGAGRRHVITGNSAEGIEKRVDVTFFEQFPGLAVLQVHYRNSGAQPVQVAGWRNAAHEVPDAPGGFWSFSGATHEDRRDWAQPLKAGFDQRNTLSLGFHSSLPWHISASGNISYGSGFLDGEGPTHLPDHTEFSLSLTKSFGERFSVGFTAQNLNNSRYLLDNSNTFGGTHWNYPRQFTGQIRYHFHF